MVNAELYRMTIARAMARKGWNAEDLAKALGVSVHSVIKYLKRPPIYEQPKKLKALADALGIEVDAFYAEVKAHE